MYQIGFDGTNLTQVQHYTLSGSVPEWGNLSFDPTGTYLYCLDHINAMLHVLDLDLEERHSHRTQFSYCA